MDAKKQLIHRASGKPTHVEKFGPYFIEPLLTEAEEVSRLTKVSKTRGRLQRYKEGDCSSIGKLKF